MHRYRAYGELAGIPHIVVDGSGQDGTVLTLSHWPGMPTPDSLRAQENARAAALKAKILELREQGQSRSEAAENASSWLATQAATHRLDGIAGGNVTDISGVGDARINSSLGSQWRSRVGDIDAAVVRFIQSHPGVDLSDVYMNVTFR
jgi:hypothetical protein